MSAWPEPFSFGALPLPDGRTRFRLWAPTAAPGLALVIEGRAPIALHPDAQGYAQVDVDCGAGTRYRYRLGDGTLVPDPASRLQQDDVHGASIVTGADAYPWRHPGWRGRPWEETVLYEVHAGLAGGYAGLRQRLPALAELGVTLLELMPLADFPGPRNWGYDGVLPYAPDTAYGSPDDLKALIDSAHGLGMGVMLDVVYNHFGPDGNFLASYAAPFFRDDIQTPWGAAIDFRQAAVRRYFAENALHWLGEYRFDGLRLDAVHAIAGHGWLEELAQHVRGQLPGRHVHLVLENDDNRASLLQAGYDAQWNDDAHHVLHHLLTGESQGYYADYAAQPSEALARCLEQGWLYQGQPSAHRGGRPRGEPSAHLPPTAFVLFLQNHDQTGNRAHGDRLTRLVPSADRLRAAVALQLLSPQIPLIFMGEEIGSESPFLYFTSHTDPALAQAVREGRRREFSSFAEFSGTDAATLPDPDDPATYARSQPWTAEQDDDAKTWLTYYRALLHLRQRALAPGRWRGADAVRQPGRSARTPAAIVGAQRGVCRPAVRIIARRLCRAGHGQRVRRQRGVPAGGRRMSATLSALAMAAGLAEHWTDARQQPRAVAPDTLRALLRAMDLPADSEADIRDSHARLAAARSQARLPAMMVAVAGGRLRLPPACAGAYEISAAHARALAGHTTTDAAGMPELTLPTVPGYYTLALPGGVTTLAVAPASAPPPSLLLDEPEPRAWGLAAQVYSLRRQAADPVQATHGFGDFGALRDLAISAGAAGADALAMSPVHAMFAADPGQYSPYSPSSRLFLNTLYADPAAVLGAEAVRAALARMGPAAQQALHALEQRDLIDWPQAARARQRLLRELHRGFQQTATADQRQALQAFCRAGGQDLRDHALFEALHENLAQLPGAPRNWTAWPDGLRDPRSNETRGFAQAQAGELDFHQFTQWLAAVSLSQTQQAARGAGMRIGLIADLAIGASPAGSHAWSHQADLMRRAGVGAPPDIHNPLGQAWGLTALSPQALRESGYAAFIALLRAGLAQAGGLRIDHILGMARLWLIPDGAAAADGAYLRYPLRTLLRLTALEAWRHRALMIGENLGTVPEGFDDALREHGLLGMDVLWFMREASAAPSPAAFTAPGAWPAQAAAMTTTHDLPTLAGWWRGRDIDWRASLDLLGPQESAADLRAARAADRESLWQAVRAHAHQPPEPAPDQVPAATLLAYVAAAPCPLALVPLEDATGMVDQPNLPGADSRHPNWRQRQPLAAADCLDAPAARERLAPLRSLRGRKP